MDFLENENTNQDEKIEEFVILGEEAGEGEEIELLETTEQVEVNYGQVWQTWGEVTTYVIVLSLLVMVVISVFRELRFWFYWR